MPICVISPGGWRVKVTGRRHAQRQNTSMSEAERIYALEQHMDSLQKRVEQIHKNMGHVLDPNGLFKALWIAREGWQDCHRDMIERDEKVKELIKTLERRIDNAMALVNLTSGTMADLARRRDHFPASPSYNPFPAVVHVDHGACRTRGCYQVFGHKGTCDPFDKS